MASETSVRKRVFTKRRLFYGAGAVGALAIFAFFSEYFFSLGGRRPLTLRVTRGDLVEAVYGLGTVVANRSYQIKIGVTTAVSALYVSEGDSVKKGDRLLKLDEGDMFRAPFAGTVTALPFKPMETIYPQMTILTLMNLADRYISVSLEQEGALRVRPGQMARINFETLRGQVFAGKVRSLYPSEGQFLVRIDIPDLPPEVLPGMTGDVSIEVARKHDIALVPLRAVQSSRVVAKAKNGRTRKITVRLGAVDGRMGELLSDDPRPGDELVVPKE